MGQRTFNAKSVNCEKLLENRNEENYVTLLRLKGGGESSLTNGTSAWGTPTSQPSNHSNGKINIVIRNMQKLLVTITFDIDALPVDLLKRSLPFSSFIFLGYLRFITKPVFLYYYPLEFIYFNKI